MSIPTPNPSDEAELIARELGGEAGWIRRRERFYERALGPMRQPAVYHWKDDNDPHIDLYVIAAGDGRPFETLITGGLADRPQPGVPRGSCLPRRVEILLRMPRVEHWAAVVLREIADMPFRWGISICEGTLIRGNHSIRPESPLIHAVLLRERDEPGLQEGFLVESETVDFLRPCFITEREYDYAEASSPLFLIDRLVRAGADGVMDVRRDSVV